MCVYIKKKKKKSKPQNCKTLDRGSQHSPNRSTEQRHVTLNSSDRISHTHVDPEMSWSQSLSRG